MRPMEDLMFWVLAWIALGFLLSMLFFRMPGRHLVQKYSNTMLLWIVFPLNPWWKQYVRSDDIRDFQDMRQRIAPIYSYFILSLLIVMAFFLWKEPLLRYLTEKNLEQAEASISSPSNTR